MDPFTTSYLSAPFHYQPDSTCNSNDPNCAWNVQTYDHTYSGVESVANATVQSDNTVYARLSLDVGPANIVAMARKLGIRTSSLEAVPSLALGSIGVTPLEMASAYFAGAVTLGFVLESCTTAATPSAQSSGPAPAPTGPLVVAAYRRINHTYAGANAKHVYQSASRVVASEPHSID